MELAQRLLVLHQLFVRAMPEESEFKPMVK